MSVRVYENPKCINVLDEKPEQEFVSFCIYYNTPELHSLFDQMVVSLTQSERDAIWLQANLPDPPTE